MIKPRGEEICRIRYCTHQNLSKDPQTSHVVL
jgi:hypothetical protein